MLARVVDVEDHETENIDDHRAIAEFIDELGRHAFDLGGALAALLLMLGFDRVNEMLHSEVLLVRRLDM
jgi:hypothetical protein